MLKNPEVERFFQPLSAHSDVAEEFLASLKQLGDFEIFQERKIEFGAIYVVTSQVAFCGTSGMRDTYWRLSQADAAIAVASGAEVASIGPGWVKIECFRSDWPKQDLNHWALRAYDYARTGA